MIKSITFVLVFLLVNFELLAADEAEKKEVLQKVRLAVRVPGGGWSVDFTDLQRERAQDALAESTLIAVKSLLEAIAEFRNCDVVFFDENGKRQPLGKSIPVSNLIFVLSSSKQSIASFAARFFPKDASEATASEATASEGSHQPNADSIQFCSGLFGSGDFNYDKDKDEKAEAARFLESHIPLRLYRIPELFNEQNFLKHVHDFSYLQFVFNALKNLLEGLEKRELKHTSVQGTTIYEFIPSEKTEKVDPDDCVSTAGESMVNALIIELGGMRAYREKFLEVLRLFYSHVWPLNGQFKDDTIVLADPLLGHKNPLLENIALYAFGASASSDTSKFEQMEVSSDQCCEMLTEIHRWRCFYCCSYELMSTIYSCAKLFVWQGSEFEYRRQNPKRILGVSIKTVDSDGSDDDSVAALPPSKDLRQRSTAKFEKKDTRSAEEILQDQQTMTDLLADEAAKRSALAKSKKTKREAAQGKKREEEQRQHEIAEKKKASEKLKLEKQQQRAAETAQRNRAEQVAKQQALKVVRVVLQEPDAVSSDLSELVLQTKSRKAMKREAAAERNALKMSSKKEAVVPVVLQEPDADSHAVIDGVSANPSRLTAPLSVDEDDQQILPQTAAQSATVGERYRNNPYGGNPVIIKNS